MKAWGSKPENTARSVLVTIFGDTLLPVGDRVWLAQLFQLTDVFGFSDRLVRTSLFRLSAEGWCTSERVGRNSRYVLTDLATKESAHAEQRIYHSSHPDWTGTWTVAFLEAPNVAEEVRDQLAQLLHWHGFISLSRGIVASPTATPERARQVCKRIAPDLHAPLARLEFEELEAVVASGFFVEALAIEDQSKAYDEFTNFYRRVNVDQDSWTPVEAFALRTMLIHDLRRIKLASPDIPAALLPADWPGDHAQRTASDVYGQLSSVASPWLSEVLELTYPEAFPARFA